MPPGLVFSTSLYSGKAIFGGFGFFLSSEERSIVIVHPHSIELLSFDIFESQAQTILDSTLAFTVISAGMVRTSDSVQDKIVILTADFRVILVSFNRNIAECKEIHDFRIEGALPNKNILMVNSENRVFLSIYNSILYVISFNEEIEINEVKIPKFTPDEMCIKDNIFVYHQGLKVFVTDSIDFAIHQEKPNDCFASFVIGNKIEFWTITSDSFLLIKNNKYTLVPLPDFIRKGFNGATYNKMPVNSNAAYARESDFGLVVSFMNSDVYLMSSESCEKLCNCPAIKQCVLVSGTVFLFITKWNGFCIYDIAKQDFSIPADDVGYIRMHTLLPHTVEGLDKLIVCNGIVPSDLHVYAQAVSFQETAVIDSIKAIALFPTEDLIIISGNDHSICVDCDYDEFRHNSLEYNERTLAFNILRTLFLIQVVPDKIIAASAKKNYVMNGSFSHAFICRKHSTIVASYESTISVIEFKETGFDLKRSFPVKGEVCAIDEYNDEIIIVTTWNSSPICLVNKETGEIVSEYTENNNIFSSICKIDDLIFLGSTTGTVLVISIDESLSIVVKRKIELSKSSVFISPGNIPNTVLVSGTAPIIIRYENGKFDTFPIVTEAFKFSAPVNSETVATIRDNVVIFGKIVPPFITRQKSMRYEGTILALCSDTRSSVVGFVGTKNDVSELQVLDSNLNLLSSEMKIEKKYAFNSLCSINLNDRLFFAVSCGVRDGTGRVLFYEFKNGDIIFLNELIFEHTVTAAAFNGTNFIVASGSLIVLHSVELSDTGDLVLQTITAQETALFSSKLITRGTRCMNLDIYKSHAIYELSFNDVSMENVDFDQKRLISGDFVGDHGSIVGTIYGEIFGMMGSGGSFAMTTFSRFRIGDIVTTISRWKLNETNDNSYIASTLTGAILKISIVDDDVYQKLNIIQKAIIKSHRKQDDEKAHRLVTPFYDVEPFGFIDGDLLAMYEGNIDSFSSLPEVTKDVIDSTKAWIKKNHESDFT